MDNTFTPVSMNETFQFSCTKTLPCFTACCSDLNQSLTPYDILRMKNGLGIKSGIFLEKFTSEHYGPESGLPIISLKPGPGPDLKCPFITEAGCGIYPDRPSSCRMYPLARGLSQSRTTGEITEHYMILKEPHCLGFTQGDTMTVEKWLKNQGLPVYNEMNDLMMEIISLKNRIIPGPLDLKSRYIFHLGCYDLDEFKKKVFEKGIIDELNPDPDTLGAIKTDETILLKTGLKWIKFMLFGKKEKL